MLSGQAKIDYQRSYMRRRRSNGRSNKPTDIHTHSVRPTALLVRPEGISDNQWNYIKFKATTYEVDE